MTDEKNDGDKFKLPLGYGSKWALQSRLMKKHPWTYYGLRGMILLLAIIIWIFE